jgi:hypothetical protein
MTPYAVIMTTLAVVFGLGFVVLCVSSISRALED